MSSVSCKAEEQFLMGSAGFELSLWSWTGPLMTDFQLRSAVPLLCHAQVQRAMQGHP